MKKTTVFVAMILWTAVAAAQTAVVRGEVFDDSGLLPGVNIAVSGQSVRVSTDADGAFAVELQPGVYDLSFSFPRYTSEVRSVNLRPDAIKDLEIEMRPAADNPDFSSAEPAKEEELSEVTRSALKIFIFVRNYLLRMP